MTREMRASLHEASKQYVQQQVQRFGAPVRRQEINGAIKKVSKVLEELEALKLRLNK
jgi:hypothetical protein